MTISRYGHTLPGRVSGRAAAPAQTSGPPASLRHLIAALPLAAKVALLTGADSWRTHACRTRKQQPVTHGTSHRSGPGACRYLRDRKSVV